MRITSVRLLVLLIKPSVGFLFRAQPTLLTAESSAVIMDAIFASDEEEGRTRLLRIMQDFLVSEADKHSIEQKGKLNLVGYINCC